MSKTPMSVPKPLLPRKKLNFLHIWTCSKKKKKKKKEFVPSKYLKSVDLLSVINAIGQN